MDDGQLTWAWLAASGEFPHSFRAWRGVAWHGMGCQPGSRRVGRPSRSGGIEVNAER
jgi:hypothetical protein